MENITLEIMHHTEWPDNNTSLHSVSSFYFYKAPLLAGYIFLFLLIVFGNLCVLTAIAVSGQGRKTRMNFFIMHLAIADLSVGLFYVTTEIATVAFNYEWVAGTYVCKLVHYGKAIVFYASTYMLVSLSIDRFDAIARPMNFSRSGFRARMLVGLSWILAVIFSIPSFVFYESRQESSLKNMTMCTIKFPQRWMWQPYLTLIAIACFLVPGLIIAVCYSIIAVIIWKKSKAIEGGPSSMGIRSNGQAFVTDFNPSRCGVVGTVIHQAKIRTIKMTFIIVAVFMICWSPYFFVSLLQVYSVIDSRYSGITIMFLHMLAPLNSAINPLIYGVFSTRICGHLRQVPIINDLIIRLQCCSFQRKASYRQSRSGSEAEQSNNGTFIRKQNLCCQKSKTNLENDTIVTLLRTNSDSTKQQVSFSPQLTNGYHVTSKKVKGYRRPSGLPLVKRNMTEEENILLRSFVCKAKQTVP